MNEKTTTTQIMSHQNPIKSADSQADKEYEQTVEGIPLNILIVEDDMLVGTHISMILTDAGYEVMGILTRGEMVLEQLKTITPDLILMDIKLKGKLDGIETAASDL